MDPSKSSVCVSNQHYCYQYCASEVCSVSKGEEMGSTLCRLPKGATRASLSSQLPPTLTLWHLQPSEAQVGQCYMWALQERQFCSRQHMKNWNSINSFCQHGGTKLRRNTFFQAETCKLQHFILEGQTPFKELKRLQETLCDFPYLHQEKQE